MNDDSNLDIVTTVAGTFHVFSGAGKGTFPNYLAYANNDASYVAIADTDNDGLPDLVGDGTATSIYFGRCVR